MSNPLRRGILKRIHVRQDRIRSNIHRLPEDREPVVTVRTSQGVRYGDTVIIKDDRGNEVARIVYRPESPLSCGARLWIESKAEIEIEGER